MFTKEHVMNIVKHEDCHGTFSKLKESPNAQKSDDFKKFSVLTEISSFL